MASPPSQVHRYILHIALYWSEPASERPRDPMHLYLARLRETSKRFLRKIKRNVTEIRKYSNSKNCTNRCVCCSMWIYSCNLWMTSYLDSFDLKFKTSKKFKTAMKTLLKVKNERPCIIRFLLAIGTNREVIASPPKGFQRNHIIINRHLSEINVL